jgi:DNA-binding transcriptional MerR regulator
MSIPYRIGAAAKLTGITVDTLRAWERRYGAVVPERGARRRGYDQADIERLILLRRAVEQKHSISSVAKLSNEEINRLLVTDRTAMGGSSELLRPIFAAIEDFDYCELNEQLGRMAAVLPAQDLVAQVVLPLMREIGDRWHTGHLSIAQEHMVSSQIHHLLGTLMRLHRPAKNSIKMVFTTPEGESHSLGILAAAMLAAGAGLSPVYLGPSLPPREIFFAVRRSKAKAVVLQITDTTVSTNAQIVKTIEGLPPGVELWLGGNCDHALEGVQQDTGSLYVIRDFTALLENYQRLMATA